MSSKTKKPRVQILVFCVCFLCLTEMILVIIRYLNYFKMFTPGLMQTLISLYTIGIRYAEYY